jgi:predicted  nucleic acid-binding Zn-ribbon protein
MSMTTQNTPQNLEQAIEEIERLKAVVAESARQVRSFQTKYEAAQLSLARMSAEHRREVEKLRSAIQLAIETLDDPYLGEDGGERHAPVIVHLRRTLS